MSNSPALMVSVSTAGTGTRVAVNANAAQSPTGNGVVVIPEGEGAGSRIPGNKSSQRLVSDDYLSTNRSSIETGSTSGAGGDNLSSSDDNTNEIAPRRTKVTKMEWITVFILFYVNLINYMDRFTLAGVLDDVKKAFDISKSEQGLLQTVFVISYMVFAPIFGYMGDRYSRRVIMSFGVLLWSITTLAGSFMENQFYWFMGFRAMVGIGEASYSTIAPTIISDLFLDDMRSRMLALFYFAIPVGGGLGYIVGAQAANLGGAWYWALRVTPVLGVIAVLLILFFMIDPPRGEREGSTTLKPTSWGEDLKALCTNKSFMLSTFGFTCVTFVTGALAWWGPTYIYYGLRLQDTGDNKTQQSDVSFIFGVITMVSGIIGVPLGSIAATKLRTRSLRADPLICAFGLIVSTPLIFGGALLARTNETACFILIFLGEVFLNLNWSIVADILLYVVIPTRRSTAEAFQILLSHALGDAGSPYLIGQVADWIKPALQDEAVRHDGVIPSPFGGHSNSNSTEDINYYVEFQSLQYSLFLNVFIQILGGLFFLATAWFIVADKSNCDVVIAQSSGGHLMPDGSSSSQSQSDDEEADEERQSLRRKKSSSSSYR